MEGQTPLLKKGDSYLYNLRNIAVHFLGDRLSRPLRENVDKRIDRQLQKTMADRPKGKLVPVDRRKKLVHQGILRRGTPANSRWYLQERLWNGPVASTGVRPVSRSVLVAMTSSSSIRLKMWTDNWSTSFPPWGEAIRKMQKDPEINVRFSPLLTLHPELKKDLDLHWYRQRTSLPPTEIQSVATLHRR
jgi:hypothetical protein